MHLPFGMLWLSTIITMFLKIMLAVCMLVGMGLSENGFCVFCELCPVSILVVAESPSVLL